MKIAAYCRVSTDKSDQLNSLETQKQFFSEYTEKNGHQLVRLYADEGISGTKIKKRKEFQTLMQDAKEGLFEMVVVKDISRFARNTVDLLQSTRALKALGIETLFLTANMTTLGNSEFVLTVFGALAQEESANTSKRIKFGKQMNAKKGRVPNLVYGYDKTIGDYFQLDINPEEARVVSQIYHWYTEEGDGTCKIASKLNERGIKTKRNCAWSQNAVCRILTNELYTGKIINGKQEVTDFLTGIRADKEENEWLVCQRPELQIISPEQFTKASSLMKSRGQAFKLEKERQSNQHLFSTLIKCKCCGWSFRRTVRTYKNTFIRWVCSAHNGKGADCCSNAISVDEDVLRSAIETYLSELFARNNDLLKTVVQTFLALYQHDNEKVVKTKELKRRLSKLQKLRQKYFDLYADDLISRSELQEKIGFSRDEMEEIESELNLLTSTSMQDDQLKTIIEQTFPTLSDLCDLRQMTNAQLKRIIHKIEVDENGTIDIYLPLLEDTRTAKTALVHNNRT